MSDALRRTKSMVVGLAVALAVTSSVHGDDNNIKGFLLDEVEQQREWEEKLRVFRARQSP